MGLNKNTDAAWAGFSVLHTQEPSLFCLKYMAAALALCVARQSGLPANYSIVLLREKQAMLVKQVAALQAQKCQVHIIITNLKTQKSCYN